MPISGSSHALSLEILSDKHVDALAKIANHALISRTSGVVPECDEMVVRSWMEKNKQPIPQEITFVINWNHQVAGCCILKKMDMARHRAELSYWLGVDFWGQGIAQKAAALLRDMAFESYELYSLHAHYLKINNPVSGYILENIGFSRDISCDDESLKGRFKVLAPDVWVFYVLTREKWQKLKDR